MKRPTSLDGPLQFTQAEMREAREGNYDPARKRIVAELAARNRYSKFVQGQQKKRKVGA